MSIVWEDKRSCQFFYFKYKQNESTLNKKLTALAKNKENDLKINYDGDSDPIKGTIRFDHQNGTVYLFQFTFNLGKNILLILGDSNIRKQVALAFIHLVFDNYSLKAPIARMTIVNSRDVCDKLIAINKNKIFNPKFNFTPYRYPFHKKLFTKLSYIFDNNTCAVNDDRKDFDDMYQFCVDNEKGIFTFIALIYGYDGIVDYDENIGVKFTVGQNYSFSLTSAIPIENWLKFSESILDAPISPLRV